MKTLKINWLLVLIVGFMACNKQIPKEYTAVNKAPDIYPDYTAITVPYNIAPLNFYINDKADEYLTHIYATGSDIVITGKKVQINIPEWKKMLADNKGKLYSVDIFLKQNQKWTKLSTISNKIAPEPIDPYISYRLIEPSYMTYELMSTNQRNITNFETREIFDNKKAGDNDNHAQCVNCHAYQNYHTDNMQLHMRQYKGGTMIVVDGEPMKVNMKVNGVISPGVYPAWHPFLKLIAYSVNNTGQIFHSKSTEKIEVVDTRSDIIIYDIKKNEIHHVVNDPNYLETFPSWSPDGKTLYYCSAHIAHDMKNDTMEVVKNYEKMKYNLLRIPFDLKTHQFGKPDTIFPAAKMGKSATFPRISPDGKYLLYTLGDFGNFHIWHKSSDLYIINLQTNQFRPMTEINSPDVDSYHSWSSNGRWIIFSSRREDGNFTRFYFTYFDKNGMATKPFVLPQKDPQFNKQFFKSFNIPEFMIEPVKLKVRDIYDVANMPAHDAKFVK